MGQPDVPARLRAERAAAERRLVRAAGREGAALAAGAGAAAPAADPDAGRAGRARRGLSVPLVGLPLARGLARGERADRRPGRASPPSWPASCARSPAIDATGGPAPGQHNFFRGGPLAYYEGEALEAIERLGDEIPREAVQRTWADAMASEWERDPVWFHGDVAAGNLLVRNGRLAAVLDFGSSGVGDPACDMAIAWTFLSGEAPRPLPRRARRRCRHLVARPRLDAVEVADHDGRRARGGRRGGDRRAPARNRRHHRRLRRGALSVSALGIVVLVLGILLFIAWLAVLSSDPRA